MVWYDLVNIGLLILIWTLITLKFSRVFHDRQFWLIFFALYTLTEFISIPMALNGINNLWLYNISKPIQFLCLLKYFSVILDLKRKATTIVILVGAFFCIVMFAYGPFDGFKSLQEVFFGAAISLCCVYYFYRIIRSEDELDLNTSEFWYCSALFIFFGTNLVINGSLDYMIRHNIAIAQRLFYGLVLSSYVLYALNLFALVSNYQYFKTRHG